jgi:pimeloyl-ACP methyl ester carboxylesterase
VIATSAEWTTVESASGDLRALVTLPEAREPVAGVVLVDGSGDGSCDDWGEWPDRFVACGAAVLTHDKPGCGGSPGDWTTQTLEDRAHESLAALRTLRRHPAVTGRPVGLLAFSQGGWVALLAATLGAGDVSFVVTVSGPGVGPAEQDRWRIARDLEASGLPPASIAEALAWIDERTRQLVAGTPVADVLAEQGSFAERDWHPITTRFFDSEPMLGFLAGLISFDPAPVLRSVPCPVLALFGAADTLVPVEPSVAAFLEQLPERPDNSHGVAVFPAADHGLFTGEPDPSVPRTDQLAPGFLPMVGGFLARAAATSAV